MLLTGWRPDLMTGQMTWLTGLLTGPMRGMLVLVEGRMGISLIPTRGSVMGFRGPGMLLLLTGQADFRFPLSPSIVLCCIGRL